MGRFIALPAAIFRPSFLPFGQTGTRCFRVQSLSFDYRHSILLCVYSPEASKLSSGLVKKLRQASTVYIFIETITKRNRATSTVLFVTHLKENILDMMKSILVTALMVLGAGSTGTHATRGVWQKPVFEEFELINSGAEGRFFNLSNVNFSDPLTVGALFIGTIIIIGKQLIKTLR